MIVRAEVRDLDALMNLETSCFAQNWSEQDFLYEMTENPYASVELLMKDGKAIGYYDLWVIFEQAELASICVLPEYQGQGYGKILLMEAEKQAMEAGCETIALEVRVSNEKAIGLYESCGFIEINRKPGYYQTADGYEDAIRMMKGI